MHDIFFQNLFRTFVAIDPLSLIPLFVVITSNIDSKQTLKLSLMVFLISSSVLTFFLLFGNVFLAFMGISINSFQIVGGIFLLFISYEMVFEKRMKRKKNLSNEILDDKNLNNIAVFPISIPLIVGPSALTLSVLISKNFNYTMLDLYTQFLPMILVLMLTSIMIIFSTYLLKVLNETIIKILQKIFGIILGALSVEFIINGIKGVV